MRNLKKFGVVMVAVFALTAIAAATASAGTFTASTTGALTKTSSGLQKFDVNNGGNATNTVECNSTAISGNVASLSTTEQLVKVTYTGCKAFFNIISVNITPAEYLFTVGGKSANNSGTADIQNTITINVGGGCNVVVGPQNVGNVTFNNAAGGDISTTSAVTGIKSNGNGGACSTSSNVGTYSGNVVVGSAGNLSYDANP